MTLQSRCTANLSRKLISHDTLIFLRAASTTTTAGTYPYNIPSNFVPPPYPYGPSTRYRRRDSGLYGSATIQYGNMVSEQNEHKSRRVWRPNVRNKKLWSNYLGKFVQVKVVARVLRTIDKVGGLDEYLVGSDAPARIKELGVSGWMLRWRVMQTRRYRERVAVERRALGLPDKGWLIEERDRKRRERKEGLRIAAAYLDALEIENKERSKTSQRVAEEMERASAEAVDEIETFNREQEDERQSSEETLEASRVDEAEVRGENGERIVASTKESSDAESNVEPEYDVLELAGESEGRAQELAYQPATDEAVRTIPEYAMPSASEQLFSQLTAIATQINTTPDTLIKQTRAMIKNRGTQLTEAAERKAQLATERATLISDINDALDLPRNGPVLNFHATQLAIARYENALLREREGKPPLTPDQIEINVTGPPSNISAEHWAKVINRVKAIQRDHPQRLQARRERQLQNAEKKKYVEEHRDDILAERQKKMKAVGLYKRMVFAVRNMRKGLTGGTRGGARQGLWSRIRVKFGRGNLKS